MPQEIYDDRLNNIKVWPNFYNINFAPDLEEYDDNPKISDYNYVLCLKKAPNQFVEDFYNGEVALDQDNYMRRIDASSFITTDNITKDIWEDNTDSIIPLEGDPAPPPYIPNTYAIRHLFLNDGEGKDTLDIRPGYASNENKHIILDLYTFKKLVMPGLFKNRDNKELSSSTTPKNTDTIPTISAILSSLDEDLWTHTGNSNSVIVDSEGVITSDNYKHHYFPTVGAIQNIISQSISSIRTNRDKYIPSLAAITEDNTQSSNSYITPDDNDHIPTNRVVNLALDNIGGAVYTYNDLFPNNTLLSTWYTLDDKGFTPKALYWILYVLGLVN